MMIMQEKTDSHEKKKNCIVDLNKYVQVKLNHKTDRKKYI